MDEKNYYVVEFVKKDLKGRRYMINTREESDKLYLIGPFEKIIARNVSFEEAEKLCGEKGI